MEFGKLPHVEDVDFRFPPEDLRTRACLKKALPHTVNVYVGAPVWNQKAWVGKIYPRGTSPSDFLKLYSQQYGAIELNSTHYGLPGHERIKKWKEAVSPEFKFCPKFPQKITHDMGLVGAEFLTQEFCNQILELGTNLGLSFIQLSPIFEKRNLPVLARYLQSLPPEVKVAVEFRHPSWFENHELLPGARDVLEMANASAVITDVAGRRDVLHTSLSDNKVLVRFIGNQLHPSDYRRIDDWVLRVAEWLKMGAQDIYFFVHQPGDLTVPELSSYFVEKLISATGLAVKNWTAPADQPILNQMSFF